MLEDFEDRSEKCINRARLNRQIERRKVKEAINVKRVAQERVMYRKPLQVTRLSHAVDMSKILNPPSTGQMEKRKTIRVRPNKAVEIRKRRYSLKTLHRALERVEREEDRIPIFEHFIRRAYSNDRVLCALMSKLLPDLKSVDAQVTQKSPFKLIIDVGRPALPGSE